MMREVLATVLVSLAAGTISAGEPNPSRQEPHRRDHAALVQVALASGERFWKRIEHDDPYRDQDLRGEQVINLQSHFVLPRDVDGLWLRGQPLKWPRVNPNTTVRFTIAAGDPLVLRKGSAAVGLRVVWSRANQPNVFVS